MSLKLKIFNITYNRCLISNCNKSQNFNHKMQRIMYDLCDLVGQRGGRIPNPEEKTVVYLKHLFLRCRF